MTTFLTALGAAAPITTNAAPQMGMANRYNASGGALSVTLPALAGLTVGANCIIQLDILDTSENGLTVTRNGTDVFDDGGTGFTLTLAGAQRSLQVVEIDAVKVWKVMDYGSPEPDLTVYQPKSVLTTKGDLYVRDNSGNIVRMPVGADGTVLTSDSGEDKGLKWEATGGAVVLHGTYAALPAAGTANRVYFCDDIELVLFDTGSAWIVVDGGSRGPVFTSPPTSSWSTTTLGSATVAADKGGRLFTIPDTAGTNARVEYRTLSPTSNYTFTAYIESCIYPSNYSSTGIWLRQSSDGKMIYFGPSWTSTPKYSLQCWKYNSATSVSTQYGTSWTIGTDLPEIPNWYRFRDDGTTRYAEFSFNGLEWITLHSIGRTDFLTADQVGWGGDVDNSGVSTKLRLRSFAVV